MPTYVGRHRFNVSGKRKGEKKSEDEIVETATHGVRSFVPKWLPFVEDIRTALWENAKEISVTVAGIRAAGVVSLGVPLGSV